jgi:hypothetical protein
MGWDGEAARATAVATTGAPGFGTGRGFSAAWALILVLFVLLAIVAAAAGFWGGGY